jgi:preprotein translocase subunit SecG
VIVSFISVLMVIIYVLVCVFLILVVLLQQGKGADLAGAFGGGGSQTSFGPRTSTNIMHRLTTISFVLFVVLSMGLAILAGKHRKDTVMSGTEAAPAAQTEQGEPALEAEAPAEDEADTAIQVEEAPAPVEDDTAAEEPTSTGE